MKKTLYYYKFKRSIKCLLKTHMKSCFGRLINNCGSKARMCVRHENLKAFTQTKHNILYVYIMIIIHFCQCVDFNLTSLLISCTNSQTDTRVILVLFKI